MPCSEMPTAYGVRPEGSSSKLSTWRDGLRILFLISRLVKDEHPFQVFGTIALGFALASLWLGVPVVARVRRDRSGAAPADGGSRDRA